MIDKAVVEKTVNFTYFFFSEMPIQEITPDISLSDLVSCKSNTQFMFPVLSA